MEEVFQSPELTKKNGPESVHISGNEQESGCDIENKVCYQANSDFITRIIAGETILVPVGEQALHLSGMVTFSETGAFLWEKLSQKRTKAELVDFLASEFGQGSDEVESDVSEFLEKAEERGLVIRCQAE